MAASVALLCTLVVVFIFRVLGQAGAELFLDGVDDYLSVFPGFSASTNWTVEVWLRPSQQSLDHTQCIFHLSTYSASNFLTLEVRGRQWKLQYGGQELSGGQQQGNITSAPISTGQQHVALTHSRIANGQAQLVLYINSSSVLSATAQVPQIIDTMGTFMVGACQQLVANGLERMHFYSGQLDELRYWSQARSENQINASMLQSGPFERWPIVLKSSNLQAQYSCDNMSTIDIVDTSGRGNNGTRGGWGVARELPRYQSSLFGSLQGGAYFHEFRRGNFTCPSSNCLDLQQLLASSGVGPINGFLVVSLPTSGGTYLTLPGNSTRLTLGMLVQNASVQVHADAVLENGLFELRPCNGSTNQVPQISACQSQDIVVFTFRVLDSRPPLAGERHSLQLLGEGGYLEIPEQFTESGTVEFWVQLMDIDETQTLFSITHRTTGAPVVLLGLANGQIIFHFCTVLQAIGGVQPFTLEVPSMLNVGQQHIAITWEYTTSVRGLAVYTLNVYRNCQRVHSKPYVIQDSCVRFGVDNSLLQLPTFGQQYQSVASGQKPGNFAAVHLGEIRVWSNARTTQQICQNKEALLQGTEANLMSFYPITLADSHRSDATLANHVPGGQPAKLRCADLRLQCPSIEKSRGYALRPSVFALPAEPVTFVTSGGRVDGIALLPALAISLPAYDPDNYEAYDLYARGRDAVNVKVVSLPDAGCGQLFWKNQSTLVAVNTILAPDSLPLYFIPNRSNLNNTQLDLKSCATNISYYAVDDFNELSPYSAIIKLFVKVVGPLVSSVTLLDRGVVNMSESRDMITIRFDRPTTRALPWEGLLSVVDGSFGQAMVSGSWNHAGDILMLSLLSNLSGMQIVSGQTKFQFHANFTTPLTTAGVDSYPAFHLSPPAQGHFNITYCANGTVFSNHTAQCEPCGFGNYKSADGLTCHACPFGSFTSSAASSQCINCTSGFYLPPGVANRSACWPASPGHFVLNVGAMHQVLCPANMVAEGDGHVHCTVCPPGATCDNTTHLRAFASPNAGHYRTSTGRISRCHTLVACEGGWNFDLQKNLCAVGMSGELCQGCLDGWWRRHEQPRSLCTECGWTHVLRIVIVMLLQCLAVWFLSVLAVDAALWGTMHAVIIRLALNYFTAISVLARIEDWELQPAIGKDLSKLLVDIIQHTLRFDGGLLVHFMQIECLLGENHRVEGRPTSTGQWPIVKGQVIIWSIAPAVWMVVLVLTSILTFECYTLFDRCRHCIQKDGTGLELLDTLNTFNTEAAKTAFLQERRMLFLFRNNAVYCHLRGRLKAILEDSIPLCVVSYFVLMPTLMRKLIIPLTCEKLGQDGSEWRLLAAPDIACWKSTHVPWAVFAILALVLWCLVVPGLVALYLWMQSETLGSDVWLKSRVGWLSDGYEANFVFWEFVIHFRRVVIVLIGTWPSLSRASELALYQVTGVVAVLLHLSVKPFDNRSGEMLDEIELYGLNLFQLLVMTLQLVFLANPDGADYDLVSVFFTGSLLLLSTILLCTSLQSLEFLSRTAIVGIFVALVGVCYMGKGVRNGLAFSLVIAAFSINMMYILWLVYKVWQELFKFIIEHSIRAHARNDKLAESTKLIQQHMDAEVHKPGRGNAQATSKMQMGMAFSNHGITCLKRLQRLFHRAKSGSGALIYFDTVAGELVLGLHPDTYMNDSHLSAYTRRMLARLGPFLTDEEREYVAMSLHDAIYHIIVELDYDRLHVSLLEFLIRLTFAWKYHKRELVGEKEEDKEPEQTFEWGKPDKPPPPKSKSSVNSSILDLMFNDEVFSHGMSAADFQAELTRITLMPRPEAQELLTSFFRLVRNQEQIEEEHEPISDDAPAFEDKRFECDLPPLPASDGAPAELAALPPP